MPRVDPPTDNSLLDSKSQAGLEMEEMIPVKGAGRSEKRIREELTERMDRMIEWCCWRMLVQGKFAARTSDAAGAMVVGDYELTTVSKLKGLTKLLHEEEQHCRLFMRSRTIKHPKRRKALYELEEDTNSEIFFYDRGFFDQGKDFNFIPGSYIIGVFGYKPIGRVFCTTVAYEKKTIEKNDYHRYSQVFLPELTRPEKLVICKL